MHKIEYFIAPILFWGLFFLDQASKHLAQQHGLILACNKGFSFGIIVSEQLFWIVKFVIILALVLFWFKRLIFYLYPAIFIFAGAFSNILDKIIYGCVLDFIKLPIFDFFPYFNLADLFIFLGITQLLFKFFETNSKNE